MNSLPTPIQMAAVTTNASSMNTNNANVTSLDYTARHLALAELKKVPANPFRGDPHLFHSWLISLKHRLSPLQAASLDIIDVIEAHTSGALRDLVVNYRTAYAHSPEAAVQMIWKKLEKSFGAKEDISAKLRSDQRYAR